MPTQRWTLVVVCVATAMLMLDIAVVNTALTRIAEDLNTGLSGLQWVVDAYTLALASVVLTAGSLADRLGRRKLFTIGLSIFTVASVLCALATDIVFLNSARAIQGVGAAIMFAVSLSLLANAYPNPKARAGALAAYGATIGASFAVGPLVGGLLTSGLGLAVDLPHQRADRHRQPRTSRGATSRSRATRTPTASTGRARPRCPRACSCWCSRCCAATSRAGRARRSCSS